MTNAEINAKVAAIRKFEEEAAKIKEQVDALKEQLKSELDNRNADSINTGIYNLIYNCYEKSSVDSKKLKEAGLYDLYTKKLTVIQFRINDVKTV